MSDLYVLVPGIMGSVLTKDGKDAFGLTASAGFRALFTAGGSVGALRTDPLAPPRTRPDDGVSATRVAADAHLIPGLWKIDGYTAVADYLVRRLRLVRDQTWLEHPYDWRLDNRIAADDLKVRVDAALARQRAKDPTAKAVLVAHSMGGLISRYYLEVLGGWRDVRSLVTFGTPYRGSLNAVGSLGNGMRKALGLIDLTDLIRSFPSVHQLLPLYPCLDRGTGRLERLTDVEAPLPGLNAEAVRLARTFHTEIEEAVTANRQDEEYLTRGCTLRRVIGSEQPTSQSAVLGAHGYDILPTWNGKDLGGDGTVPRPSATPFELDDDSDAFFAATRHASLQNTDAALVQLRGWFTATDLSDFRAPELVELSLGLDDLYAAHEPVHVTLAASSAAPRLEYRLEPVGADGPPFTGQLPRADGRQDLELPALPPGCWRLTVSGPTGSGAVGPVSDLLVVAAR